MHCRLIAVAASVLFSLCMTVPAHAGTYSVWSCADGSGRPLSAGDWSPATIGTQASATSTCGSNTTGGVAGNLQAAVGAGPSQPADSVGASWNLRAAAGTTISAFDIWWTNSASVQAPGRVQIVSSIPTAPKSLYLRDAGSFGNVTTPFAEGNHQSFTGLSESNVSLYVWCLSTCARDARAISAVLNAYRVRAVVSDVVAPTGEASGVTPGAAITGPLELQARASDAGGGVRDLQLVVDGAVVDTKQAGGQCQDIDPSTGDASDYSVMRPCAPQLPDSAAAPATFSVTPAMLATAGPHLIEIVAHDAAGNPATLLSAPVRVPPALVDAGVFRNPDVDLAGEPRPNGLNAAPAKVTLAFVAGRRVVRTDGKLRVTRRLTSRMTAGYNTVTRMRGRLKSILGQPIVGARVYRAISVAGGPWRISGKPLITSKTGSVSVRMPARSPSRRVQLVYFPTTDSNLSFQSPVRLLRVRAPVSLSVNRRTVPRGGSVVLTSRVRAGIRPGAAVIGVVQLYDRGGWRTIRQLRFSSRSRGVVSTRLRLRTPDVYRLRVRVSAQPGLRYTAGASRSRVVRAR